MNTDQIKKRLLSMQDAEYKRFCLSLMPGYDPSRVIGVRMPKLRALAKEMAGTECATEFMRSLPHAYYEENNLHVFLINQIKDLKACLAELERFLPYVDNWASCDSLRPVCFRQNKNSLLPHVKRFISSEHEYTVRYGIEALMLYFLDGEYFDAECLKTVANIRRDEYYIKMMVAWYFATALTKQYGATLPYIEDRVLSPWIHAKTVSKALESLCIPEDKKKYLRTLK